MGNRSALVLDLLIPNTMFKGPYLSLQHSICDKNQSKKLQTVTSDFVLSICNY